MVNSLLVGQGEIKGTLLKGVLSKWFVSLVKQATERRHLNMAFVGCFTRLPSQPSTRSPFQVALPPERLLEPFLEQVLVRKIVLGRRGQDASAYGPAHLGNPQRVVNLTEPNRLTEPGVRVKTEASNFHNKKAFRPGQIHQPLTGGWEF